MDKGNIKEGIKKLNDFIKDMDFIIENVTHIK